MDLRMPSSGCLIFLSIYCLAFYFGTELDAQQCTPNIWTWGCGGRSMHANVFDLFVHLQSPCGVRLSRQGHTTRQIHPASFCCCLEGESERERQRARQTEHAWQQNAECGGAYSLDIPLSIIRGSSHHPGPALGISLRPCAPMLVRWPSPPPWLSPCWLRRLGGGLLPLGAAWGAGRLWGAWGGAGRIKPH